MATEFGITVGEGRSPVGLTMPQLIRVALRRNPRRAQLLVSTVLGKHLPVDPRVVAGAGRLLGALVSLTLADRVNAVPADWQRAADATVSGSDHAALLELFDTQATGGPPDCLTLGFAETATSLGHLVADQLGSAYLHSTRRVDGDVPVAAEFAEPHSHAVGHLLRPVSAKLLTGDGPVVLVDDELSTGRTALNVIESLQAVAPRERYVLAGLVDLRSAEDDRTLTGVAARLGCRIDVVSLVRGSITVPEDARERVWGYVGSSDAGVPEEPAAGAAQWSHMTVPWPAAVPMGGRHGFLPHDRTDFDAALQAVATTVAKQYPGPGRILVIGTEEFMYLPLRLALELGRNPLHRMAFQSTTRSPVHAARAAGYPIRGRIDFMGTERPGDTDHLVTRHVYNADWPVSDGEPPQEADLVIVIDDGLAVEGMDGVAARIATATGAPVLLVVLEPDTDPGGAGTADPEMITR